MRFVKLGLGCLVAGGAVAVLSAQEAPRAGAPTRAGGPAEQRVWAPKAVKLNDWVAPHKPHTKLADVLAKHKGQTDWTELIADDDNLHAAYISMGPRGKTPRRMNADTREWWVIQAGEIRFTIDGQEPFVASKGYLVQVPYRTMYMMETVGDQPSLRFEVNIAKARKMYPMDAKPVPLAGFEFIQVRVPGQGTYSEGNKPFVDFNAVVAGTDKTRRFVHDDRAVANIILGKGIPPPPLTDRGHFHPESAEFWFILLGKIRYNIEGLNVFEADQGDIVYVPKQRFHLASFAGDDLSCRLAMNGYTDLSHSYEARNPK
jgi:mannose-6-phosphate isomerase-like protein (cupin superfamily)